MVSQLELVFYRCTCTSLLCLCSYKTDQKLQRKNELSRAYFPGSFQVNGHQFSEIILRHKRDGRIHQSHKVFSKPGGCCGKNSAVHGYSKTFYLATFGLIVSFALNVLSLLKKSRPLYYAVLAANIMSWILAMLYFALAVYDLEKALKSGSNGECCISVLYHHQNGCYEELNWLKKTYVLYFLAAILTTFVALVIIYGSIYKHVKRRSFESVTPTTEERMEITHTMYRSILNCSAFALCWLPYFISELLEKHACCRTECPSYLQVLKIICFSSQGLVNSIVYGWSRTTFRKLRLSDAQLSSSLVFFTRYNRSNYNYMAISDTELESSCEHIK